MRTTLFTLMTACCLLLCPVAHATSAQTPLFGNSRDFTLSYSVYMGGFQAMTLSMDFHLAGTAYQAEMKAKPYGLLGHLLPWAGEYSVKGHKTGKTLVPDEHIKLSQWQKDKDRYVFRYTNGVLTGLDSLVTESGKTEKKALAPDASLHKNSVDIMTAAIRLMNELTTEGDCTSSSIIFDGKRRFEMNFSDKGVETLRASQYNSFKGKAHICEAEMVPLLGYKKKPQGYYKIQEEARSRGQLPRVWMAQAWQDGPFIPVRMLVKSEFGAVFVHLKKIERK